MVAVALDPTKPESTSHGRRIGCRNNPGLLDNAGESDGRCQATLPRPQRHGREGRGSRS